MFIQFGSKNKIYQISKRDYSYDYSKKESKNIDMTLSGRYLSKYPNITIPISEFDKYPMISSIKKFEQLIQSNIKTKCEIVIGSGANGILQNIIKILFGKEKKGNLITPFFSFDQVEYATTSFGKKTKRVYTKNYNIDIDNILKSIDKNTRAIYICNPVNPTGIFVKSKKYIDLAKKIKIPLIIDESGIEFSKEKSILDICSKLPENLLVVKSFSKAYGLANLRIGYLACSKDFKDIYLKNITTNEYSGLSCLIAEKMIMDKTKLVKANIEQIILERNKLKNELNRMGIKTIKSNSNTLFTKTIFREEILKELENNDISVVDIYDKDNNLHLRIAVQDKKTNNKFINKMEKIIKSGNYIIGEFEDK